MKLAIVTPWFGSDQAGGAERQAWQIAQRLAARGHEVEVLTTCCRSFHGDWGANDLPEGDAVEGRALVRRFPVDQRQAGEFDALNAQLLAMPGKDLVPGLSPLSTAKEATFLRDNINSGRLLQYLTCSARKYQAFIFTPYLYGPIINGLPLVADRAFLQPCLHDEVYAYLACVERVFHMAKGILYYSAGEAELGQRLYGPAVVHKGVMIGGGVETNVECAKSWKPLEQAKHRLPVNRFILYLGRRDPTKNTVFLVRAFQQFKQLNPESNLALVLAGAGTVSYQNQEQNIVDLGLVDENDKLTLLVQCLALVQPSKNESYSRVMMEAWLAKKPVAVHADCLATSLAVASAQGGWTAGSLSQWIELFHRIDKANAEELVRLGRQGARYAGEYADWERVMARYEEVLDSSAVGDCKKQIGTGVRPIKKAVHQLLPNLISGDAISNHAIYIRNHLRKHGFRSEIFVRYLGHGMSSEGSPFQNHLIKSEDGLIYHHSIGSELTPIAKEHAGVKLFIYHNITPPHFFAPYDSAFANLLSEGLTNLRNLSRDFPHAVGVSKFNAAELRRVGFDDPYVLPVVVDPGTLQGHADQATLTALRSPVKKNVLFVGRLCPNKRQDDLIRLFRQLRDMDDDVRLCLVGGGDEADDYVRMLFSLTAELGLTDDVIFSGKVSHAELLAYYRAADLFVSMSEHEGFGVPLVEAIWFDIPVIAFKSTAVPETLGEAGVLITDKDDFLQLAGLCNVALTDAGLREKMIRAGRRQREKFSARSLQPIYEQRLLSLFANA